MLHGSCAIQPVYMLGSGEMAGKNEGVGVTVKYKYDQELFRQYTRNACERRVTECQFADDSALLASTRSGAENAAL